MNSAYGKVILGQALLVVCCIFYLIWWSVSYRPGVNVNRSLGWNGLLLLITAASGVAGIALSVMGATELPKLRAPKLNGGYVAIAGIAVYIALLLITRLAFQRPVTTELLLITGWVVLELTVIGSLNAAGKMTEAGFWIMIVVIAVAFLISMILYVLYYRMEPMAAFHAAMVPLITEGVSMGILLIVTLV